MTAAVRRAVRRPMASLTDVTFDPPFDTACCGPVQKTMSYQASTCPDVWREISPTPNRCSWAYLYFYYCEEQPNGKQWNVHHFQVKVKIPYKLIYKHSLPFPGIGVTVFYKTQCWQDHQQRFFATCRGRCCYGRELRRRRGQIATLRPINFDRWFE